MQRTTRVRAGQLVVAEVAVAAVVAAAFGPGWVLIGVGALAAAVLMATFGRAGGRWWYEAVAGQRRFRRRRRRAAEHVLAAAVGTSAGPPHLPWLRTLASSLALRAVQVGTVTVGVGDRSGRLVRRRRGRLVPGGRSGRWHRTIDRPALGRPDGRCPAVTPVPFAELASLVELPGRIGLLSPACKSMLVAGDAPGEARPAWVAVRVTPADALAAERSGGVEAVERRVAAAALRAARTLDGHGWPARAVGPDGLLAVLVGGDRPGRAAAGTLERVAIGPARAYPLQRHRLDVRHMARWRPASLSLRSRSSARASRPCSLQSRRRPRRWLDLAETWSQAAAAAGVRLRRLDGEQAPAVYATAPTAMPPTLGLLVRGRRGGGTEPADRPRVGRTTTSSPV